MKITTILLIVAGIVVLLFVVTQVFSMKTTSDTEVRAYQVLKVYPDFEIRKYEAASFTYVDLPSSSYRENSGQGFSTLARYIFGGNKEEQKIAMTSPVTVTMGEKMSMAFMVPSNMDAKNLPVPNDTNVKFKEAPADVVAAIRFGGWASDERLEEHRLVLENALRAEGIVASGPFSYLGYNPPFELLNRRNEVIVTVEWPAEGSNN